MDIRTQRLLPSDDGERVFTLCARCGERHPVKLTMTDPVDPRRVDARPDPRRARPQ
jgi:hypothetical protein